MNELLLYFRITVSTVLLRDGNGLILLNPDHIWTSNDTPAQRRLFLKLGFESVVYQGSALIVDPIQLVLISPDDHRRPSVESLFRHWTD